jgi:hypothetical protein
MPPLPRRDRRVELDGVLVRQSPVPVPELLADEARKTFKELMPKVRSILDSTPPQPVPLTAREIQRLLAAIAYTLEPDPVPVDPNQVDL